MKEFPSGSFEVDAPFDLEVLADAAAAALALPDLRGGSADAARARRAAVHAAGPCVLNRRLSDCLGIGVRAVQSLRAQRSEPSVVRAVEQQAFLRSRTKMALSRIDGQGRFRS